MSSNNTNWVANVALVVAILSACASGFSTYISWQNLEAKKENLSIKFHRLLKNHKSTVKKSQDPEHPGTIEVHWQAYITNNSENPLTIENISTSELIKKETHRSPYNKITINGKPIELPIKIDSASTHKIDIAIFIKTPKSHWAMMANKVDKKTTLHEIMLPYVRDLSLDVFGNYMRSSMVTEDEIKRVLDREKLQRNPIAKILLTTTRGNKFWEHAKFYD